jgi:repressor of nif and glnA expression
MTDDDAEALYGKLEETLTAAGFSWIAEQVADYVRGGRLEPVQISTRANTTLFVEAIQEGWQGGADRRNRYVRSVPFTAAERLDTLLGAVSEVTLEFPAMLSRAAIGITADSGLQGIALVDESGQRMDVTAESRIARSQELDHLVSLIDGTRAELP